MAKITNQIVKTCNKCHKCTDTSQIYNSITNQTPTSNYLLNISTWLFTNISNTAHSKTQLLIFPPNLLFLYPFFFLEMATPPFQSLRINAQEPILHSSPSQTPHMQPDSSRCGLLLPLWPLLTTSTTPTWSRLHRLSPGFFNNFLIKLSASTLPPQGSKPTQILQFLFSKPTFPLHWE